MGTRTSSLKVKGTSMEDAFGLAKKEAQLEYGNDYYNGRINNCSLIGNRTTAYRSAKDKQEFIYSTQDKLCKKEAIGVCLKEPKSNPNKVKSVVKNSPQKGTRQWVTVYEVFVGWVVPEKVAEDFSQTGAIKKARAYTEKHKKKTYVEISKRLKQGVTTVAEVSYKESSKESMGEYLFIYAAPE